jgi:hypothetical protein
LSRSRPLSAENGFLGSVATDCPRNLAPGWRGEIVPRNSGETRVGEILRAYIPSYAPRSLGHLMHFPMNKSDWLHVLAMTVGTSPTATAARRSPGGGSEQVGSGSARSAAVHTLFAPCQNPQCLRGISDDSRVSKPTVRLDSIERHELGSPAGWPRALAKVKKPVWEPPEWISGEAGPNRWIGLTIG